MSSCRLPAHFRTSNGIWDRGLNKTQMSQTSIAVESSQDNNRGLLRGAKRLLKLTKELTSTTGAGFRKMNLQGRIL